MADLVTRSSLLAALEIGAANGRTCRELVRKIIGCESAATERRVRHVVSELRKEGHHICAHPNQGYFIAAGAEELERTCRFLFSRAMDSLEQVAAMKRVSLPDLKGQLRLRD